MIIRQAELGDLDSIVLLTVRCDKFQSHYPGFLERKENITEILKESVSARLKDNNFLYVVAEEDKKIVGIVLANIVDRKDIKAEKCGALSSLYVEDKFRGRGVASKLVQEATRWLSKNSAYLVDAHVFPDNRVAQNFWDKMGFKSIIDVKSKDSRS